MNRFREDTEKLCGMLDEACRQGLLSAGEDEDELAVKMQPGDRAQVRVYTAAYMSVLRKIPYSHPMLDALSQAAGMDMRPSLLSAMLHTAGKDVSIKHVSSVVEQLRAVLESEEVMKEIDILSFVSSMETQYGKGGE